MTDQPAVRRRQSAFRFRYRIQVARRLLRRRTRGPEASTHIAVVYVYPVVGQPLHDESARRFVSTYREFPPLHDHSLHVVFNGGEPSAENIALFDGLGAEFHRHDNSGWDIGAFQMAARAIDCDLMVCLGANSHFKRAGWLRRMAGSARKRGDGLYGSSASYERVPHIRTTAFWCDPMLIRAYPKHVRTFEDRYEFEASSVSMTRLAESIGLLCWLVTWDGEYAKPQWRTPPDIFRRGDQSNSLVFDRYFELYADMDAESRAAMAALADTADAADIELDRTFESDRADELNAAAAEPDADGSRGKAFPESVAAHYWCRGKGIEIGASAHNPFGLDTINVDIVVEGAAQDEQTRLVGERAKIDIIAPGDQLPVDDNSQDFVISSHVLEHFPDPISALLEWHRVVRPGGVIYMIVPHKERTFDRDRERTTLAHLIQDHELGAESDDSWAHQHVWITQDVVELVEWMDGKLGVSWHIGELQDVDDKVGNGFAIALVVDAAAPADAQDDVTGTTDASHAETPAESA